MSANALCILEKLGISQDVKDCEEFLLLENLLSHVNAENIASIEEIEALDYADLMEMDDGDIVKKLKEHGIDEDVFEINESSIEHLQNKLKFLEGDKWDCIINDLREQHEKLKRTLKELEEQLDALNINALVKSGEETWRKTWLGLEQLFQELKSMNNRNNTASDSFNEFSVSFQKESNLFIECVTQYVRKTWSGIIPNTNGKMENSDSGDNLCNLTNNSQANVYRASKLTNIKNRLTGVFYNILQDKEKGECIDKSEFESAPTCTLEEMNRNVLDLKDDIIKLSEKQILLQIKENEDLLNLECIRAERESWLKSSVELIQVLLKQQVLMDIVSVLKYLWDQPNRATQELLNYSIEYFHEELANMKTRIAYLAEHKKEFESYLNGKPNMLPQKLEQLTNKYFPLEEECLQDMITTLENKLHKTVHQQRTRLLDSEKHLSEVENNIVSVEKDLNTIAKTISQLTAGFSAALQLLEMKKEERISVNCIPMKNCEMT